MKKLLLLMFLMSSIVVLSGCVNKTVTEGPDVQELSDSDGEHRRTVQNLDDARYQEQYETKDADGNWVLDYTLETEVLGDGKVKEIKTNPDGSVEESYIDRPNKKMEIIVRYPDGTIENKYLQSDDSFKVTKTNPDGSKEEYVQMPEEHQP